MKKFTRTTIFALLLLLVLSGFCCCGDMDETQSSAQLTGQISIIYPEEAQLDSFENEPIAFDDGDTVLDVLEQFAADNSIELDIENGSSSYVAAIGGVREGTYGDVSGWVYTVNEQEVMKSADAYVLEDNDEIEWKYVSWE